jgi:hypothetical protein
MSGWMTGNRDSKYDAIDNQGKCQDKDCTQCGGS